MGRSVILVAFGMVRLLDVPVRRVIGAKPVYIQSAGIIAAGVPWCVKWY